MRGREIIGAAWRGWMPDGARVAFSRPGARGSLLCPRRGFVPLDAGHGAMESARVALGSRGHDPGLGSAWGRIQGAVVAVEAVGGEVPGASLRRDLAEVGVPLQDGRLAEIVLHLLARSRQRDLAGRLVDAGWQLRGGYSVIVGTEGALLALCGPYGLHSLSMGFLGDDAVLASRASTLDELGCVGVRLLAPGELVVITPGAAPKGLAPLPRREPQRCALARLRFDPPQHHWGLRRALGEAMAAHLPAEAELVLAADAESLPAALGFAGRRQVMAWPADISHLAPVLSGEAVALVAVAGVDPATLEAKRAALIACGADEVLIRVVGPPTRGCEYGHPAPEGASSGSEHLSLEVLSRALGDGHCLGCLGGGWPVPREEADQLGLFGGGAADHTSTRPG